MRIIKQVMLNESSTHVLISGSHCKYRIMHDVINTKPVPRCSDENLLKPMFLEHVLLCFESVNFGYKFTICAAA